MQRCDNVKKIKYSLVIVVFVMIFLFVFNLSVSAYTVGDSINFNANNIQQETHGSTNTVTRTEQEQFMDNANWSNNESIRQAYRNYAWADGNSNESYITQAGDRVVYTDYVPVTKEVLYEIASKRYEYYSGGYGYNINTNNGLYDQYQSSVSLAPHDYQYLNSVGYGYGFNFGNGTYVPNGYEPLHSVQNYPGRLVEVMDTIIRSQLEVAYDAVEREVIVGDETIKDFSDYPTRLQALDTYLNYAGSTDEILTQRIIEIKVNSKSTSALWQSTPQSWGVTGQTHFWEFECIESFDGSFHSPLTMFGGPSVTQAFYFPGKYHVTATQILNQKYCEAISYDVNEYWVIAATGQVIYKSESNGSAIPNNGKPLADQNLYQVSSTKVVDQGTYYVPVLDQTITVSRGSWNYQMSSPSIWGYSFSSQRIE